MKACVHAQTCKNTLPGFTELHDGRVSNVVKDLAHCGHRVKLLGSKQLFHVRQIKHGLSDVVKHTCALVCGDVLGNEALLQVGRQIQMVLGISSYCMRACAEVENTAP